MTLFGSIASHGNVREWSLTSLRSMLARIDRTGISDLPLLGVSLHSGVHLRASDDGRQAASEDLRGYKIVEAGDIIMNRLGKPHGSVGVSKWRGITSPAYWVMHVDRSLATPRYTHYLLRSRHVVAEYERLGKYMPPNQFDIGWSDFRSITVPLPPLEEQRRIADFLDAETARIDKFTVLRSQQKERINERWEAALFHQMASLVSKPVELRRLGVSVTTGPFGTAFSAAEYQDDGVPMINPVHIKEGRLLPDDIHRLSVETAARLRRHRLKAGDLVVGRKGDIGRAAMVHPEQDGWVCGSDSIAIHIDGSRLRPRFLSLMLRSQFVRSQLIARSLAATMPSLSEGNLLELQIPSATIRDQDDVIAQLDTLERWTSSTKALMARQLELLGERRQALVTAAVTGQFDVTTGRGADLS